ncbi:uncharacterized protein LOC127423056 [Myxocyprinus asiaticus]|uniref:uncharacterized protein LOC127423056 n=1 Tax=Myxocyprinus asiaticus TaxID=70543 RepID=UPI00222368C8|nr:uncharacterized protein LOC127423056 [Myxocyprinus asiaticus]
MDTSRGYSNTCCSLQQLLLLLLTPLDTPVGVGEQVCSFITTGLFPSHSSLCNNTSFEFHAITTMQPTKIHVVVIYRPPGQLTNYLEELDVLLSSLPEDGRPLVVLGDFNIHQDKPQATELNTLLASFDLERLHTTATHRSGNKLDLIFTRQHVLHHPAPGCLMSFVNIGLRWQKSKDPADLGKYQSLLATFSDNFKSAKTSYYQNKINSTTDTRSLFRTFKTLLCPPPPPPDTSLTADVFATFFTNKVTTISNTFSAPHRQTPISCMQLFCLYVLSSD